MILKIFFQNNKLITEIYLSNIIFLINVIFIIKCLTSYKMYRTYFVKSLSTKKYFIGYTGAESAQKNGNYDPVNVNIRIAKKFKKHKELLQVYETQGRKDFVFKFIKDFENEIDAAESCHDMYCTMSIKGISLNDSYDKPIKIECPYCKEEFLDKHLFTHNQKCKKLSTTISDDFEKDLQ